MKGGQTVTYESLQAIFRLRVLTTESDYRQAKSVWDDHLEPTFQQTWTRAGVCEYRELLAMLINRYEHEQEENL